MKKTTREFGVCPSCNGKGGELAKSSPIVKGFEKVRCTLCDGMGGLLIKETIEESDDMKEFIEKKCGWELVEPTYCCESCYQNKPCEKQPGIKVCMQKHIHCGEYNPGSYK